MATTFSTVVNNFATTLATAYASGSSLVVASGAGADLVARLAAEGQPSLSATNWIRLTIDDGTNQTVFKCTARSANTLTVALLEGTVPAGGYAVGALVQARWTSGAVREIAAAVNALETTAATVTSVGMTVPTGLSVAGSPITTSGTLAVTLGIAGILKGSGGAITAAVAGTDYAAVSHAHAASDVTSGTIDTARLGSGTANSSSFLRGDQTWAAPTATTPGGASGTVQYNNAGAFGGFGSWDGTVLGLASSQYFRVGAGTAVAQEILRAGDYRCIHTSGGITNFFAGVLSGTTTITGTGNTGLGVSSMRASTTSANSTCVGADSGRLGATLTSCTFLGASAGYSAGSSSGTASSAVLIGSGAAQNATTTVRAVAIGASNLNAATNVTEVHVIGAFCAYAASAPSASVAIGTYALYTATTLTTSVAIGNLAGAYTTSSTANVFLGNSAGSALTSTSAGCTFVGDSAGSASPTPTSLSYAIGLGYLAQPTASNIAAIGGSGSYAVAILIHKRSAPADADITTSGLAIWFDDTPGATKVKFKGKDSGGTVRTGEVALS